MSLFQLILYVSIAGLICTFATYFVLKNKDSFIISFLQNTVGILFLFSGWVKAIDPMGTAFKMKDYFGEFQSAFEHSAMSFMSGIFPWMSRHAIAFSVAMIVFEMLLGLALIIGWRRKLTAWLFTLLVIFFAILTGYTFLTGYVPRDNYFFQFSAWSSAFDPNNMRVTDCGCFGDFIKLDPRVSFMKDLVLLVPGVLFILFAKKAHKLLSKKMRNTVMLLTALGLLFYCFSNYVWDLPHIDFRPFKEGVNIREQKQLEEQAMANVQILGWEMINTNTEETVKVMNPKYSEVIKDYPKEKGWAVKGQVQSEPTIKSTKISEFDVSDIDGNEQIEDLLHDPNYRFWVINYKLPFEEVTQQVSYRDSLFISDTLADGKITKHLDKIVTKTKEQTSYVWDDDFVQDHLRIKPVVDAAAQDNIGTTAIIKVSPPELMQSYRDAMNMDLQVYKADDILLKTIIRSNPGLLLVKDGQIIKKWHKSKIPSYTDIKSKYLQK